MDILRIKDNIRRKKSPIIIPSRGTHVILPNTFSSREYGVLIPRTSDNRVAFLLPFEGVTIAGTTDVPIKEIPKNIQLISPSNDEVNLITNEINNYLDVPVNTSDIDAVWSGIRPLAQIPKGYTQNIINGIPYIECPPNNKNVSQNDNEKKEEILDTANISRNH